MQAPRDTLPTSLLDRLADAFVHLGRDWRYAYVNPAAEELLGRPAGQLLGQSMWDVFPPPPDSPFTDPLRRAMETGEAARIEGFRARDERWFELHLYPSDAGLSILFRDVTERRVEDERRRARDAEAHRRLAELETIYATTPVGLCFLDPDLRFVSVNERMAAWNGRPVAAHLGRTLRECAPTLADLAEPLFRQVVETGTPILNQELRDAPDDDPVRESDWLVSYLPVRGADGQLLGVNAVVEDITDRKRTEDALRLSERRFRALADAAPQSVWTVGPDGAVRYLNRLGRDYLGLAEDADPFDWALVIHPDDLAQTHDRWRRAVETGGLYEDEFRLRRHDGVYRWHLARALPVRDESGAIRHWCGTSTDIHDLKQAQQALLEREHLFRTMADAAPVMIWIANEARARTYFNHGWLAYTGRTLEEELGYGWVDGVHPDDRAACLRAYEGAFEARTPFRSEYRLRRHDGSYRWILIHGTPLVDAGRFTGFIGSGIDIHERRQAEAQLAFLAAAGPILSSSLDYEETLQSVADLMVPDLADWCSIDVLDGDGGIRRVAVAHTDPAKVRWAWELLERYPPDPRAPTGVPNVLRTGQSEFYPEIPQELLRKAARDEEHWRVIEQVGFRSAVVVPLFARGQTLGALTLVWSDSDRRYTEADLHFAEELARRAGVVVDNARLFREAREARAALQALNETLEARVVERTEALTAANRQLREEVEERRRAEHALGRANTMLEYRNRELQDFAYVASHDLQEPLRKIRSFADILVQEFGERLGDGRPYLRRIDEASERMIRLIRDLLAFSRVATQGQAFEPLDLQDAARAALEDLDVSLDESGGRVEVDALCTVEADPLQMQQLFQNLIANALKFHREGVPPVIRIRATHEDAQTCRIEVEDNGIGFEEKYLDRIFSPFQRLHARDQYPGTGMGLAICRRIVERHGGTITARSTPGQGSVFVIRLPLAHPAGPAA